MVRATTRSVGQDAEAVAERYLARHGLQVIDRNFRRRFGEIDLVMQDGETIVIVEVRYRASNRFATPRITVDERKQRKLIRTASLYLAQRPKFAASVVRFDVVAVAGGRIEWLRDAFRPVDASL